MGDVNYLYSDDFLRKFIDAYISESVLAGSKQISLEEFELKVRENVSKRLNVPLKLVAELHRPFHWVLIRGAGIEAIFDFQQPIYRGDKTTVALKKEYAVDGISLHKDILFNEYREYFRAKVDLFLKS
jgi:hypothetical protein